MNTLAGHKCTACKRDSPKVTDEDVAELYPQIPDWIMSDQDGIDRLHRKFSFDDFQTAMKFANKVGDAAEEEGHHPKITVEWGKVNISWWTHKIRGLHRNDFIMAAKTDSILNSLRDE